MKKTFVGVLAQPHYPAAMGSAFAQTAAADGLAMTADEKEKAKKIYFERCAGCHGVLRKGATGKNLEPHWTKKQGRQRHRRRYAQARPAAPGKDHWLRHRRRHGQLRRYPDQGRADPDGAYIQNTPDVPPSTAWDTVDSWKVIVPVDKRLTKQMNKINLKNVFSVTLRDTGEVALIDGDTKEIVNIVKTGYTVHISRLSASGRYVYVVGRDGRLVPDRPVDGKPAVVAEVKIGFDARSVDTSKFKGFEDKYAVAGSYWPSQYVIMDGDTLKPLKVVSTRA